MATKSVSQQLAELRAYTITLEGELSSLRDINKDQAARLVIARNCYASHVAEIAKLKASRTGSVRKPFRSLSDWVPLYLKAHPNHQGCIPFKVLGEFACAQRELGVSP